MIAFPNCKINLGLNIVAKRSDGFHDLETVFYPVNWTDALELIRTDDKGDISISDIVYSASGLSLGDDVSQNLCIRAWQLLKKDFDLPPAKIHLHKSIPVGAGLGGGSADAAFMLKLIDRKFSLGLSKEKMLDYALQLGSDCPFFIINQPCFATGRGEFLEKIELDLSAWKIIIVYPQIHVNTGWAFSQVSPAAPAKSIRQIIQQPIDSWKNDLRNDFEEIVFAKHPEIRQVKQAFYDAGAVYSSMSGSGSTVYALFKKDQAPVFNFPSHYLVKSLVGNVQ